MSALGHSRTNQPGVKPLRCLLWSNSGQTRGGWFLSAGPPVVHIIGCPLACLRQVEKLLFDKWVDCLFGNLAVFGCLFSQIVGVVHHNGHSVSVANSAAHHCTS